MEVERVTGIEPAWPAWKAGALPLSYTRARPRAHHKAKPQRTRWVSRVPTASRLPNEP